VTTTVDPDDIFAGIEDLIPPGEDMGSIIVG